MKSVAVLLLLGVALLAAAAHAAPVRYDQRQDGDWNVDARLQNFFVVLSPSNSAQLGASGISLLDFASKAVPFRPRPSTQPSGDSEPEEGGRLPAKQREELAEELEEAKEVAVAMARSAPDDIYPQPMVVSVNAVPPVFTKDDIVKSPLAKLHPEMQVAPTVEEVLIAHSPVVALRVNEVPSLGAVPMLVAVPVPEVAPVGPAPGPVPADLPVVLPAQTQALDEASAPSPLAEVPEVEVAAPAEDFVVPAAAISSAPSEPSLESNQVDVNADSSKAVPIASSLLRESAGSDKVPEPPRLHLVGTGIEDCGPARHRDQEGVCVDDRD